MGARHRRGSRRAARITRIGVATATATAMAVSVAPPQAPQKPEVYQSVDLAAAIQLLPDSGQYPNPKTYPDLTGGLGTTIYDFNQTLLDQLIRSVVNGVSLTALAQAAGVDPQSLVTALLADIPANLLPSILASISLDLPILDTVLGTLGLGDQALLTNVLNLLGVDEITDGTLTGLLALLGLDLSDPLNLANLNVPGVNLITAGPTFTALKLLGLDLGWVPSLPNSVAAEINGTPYLELGVDGIIDLVTGLLDDAVANNVLNVPLLDGLLTGLGLGDILGGLDLNEKVAALVQTLGDVVQLADPITGALPDILHARVTPTVGIGIGAFAAAMAYQKVIADLENQPGGSAYTGVNPLLGSLTILPMILINNPARPDGGALARFGPLAALLGIDTVNPRTELTGDGGVPVGNTGLHLGGANVLPILIDATYEYQPLSDLASWPNPFTLVNNLAAGLLPTYMLRGLSLNGLADQLTPQLAAALAGVAAGNPLALNLYLTLNSSTSPTLEPLYLASDLLNLVGLAPLAQIPMRIANALAPALRILTDVGYANVVRNADGTYTRDFSTAGDEVPFLSFPNLNPGLVLSDTIAALFGGIQKELGPNPTPNTPNVLANLLNAILGGGLGGLLGGVNPLAATQTSSPLSATALPSTNARLTSLSAAVEAESSEESVVAAKDGSKTEEAVVATESEPAAVTPAADDVVAPTAPTAPEQTEQATVPAADESTPPKHAKPEDDAAPVVDSATPPKHAKDADTPAADPASEDAAPPTKPKPNKPALNVVRDSLDASPPKDVKPGEKPGDGDKKDDTAAGAAESSSTGASEGSAA